MLLARSALPALAALSSLLLAACGGPDDSSIGVAVVGDPDDPFSSRAPLPLAGQLVRAATTEGLVAFDEQGRVIPALAERWIVTDDGQSYIFRLRNGNWSDGSPLSATSVRRSVRAALSNLEGSSLASDLAGIEDVRAMAGRVIEIRLSRPMPYLLQLMAQPELGLVNDDRGAGPMTLDRGVDGVAALSPIDPAKLGLPEVPDWASTTRQVRLRAMPGEQAIQAFNDGEVDLVLGGRIENFPLTRSVGILRGTIQLDPVAGLFGLLVMHDRGILAEPARREALAMAIDREALMAPFGVGGWAPSTRIVTPSLDGELGTVGERWSEQSLDARREIAVARLRGWQGEGAGRPHLRIALPEGEGAQTIFARLRADFAAIGVKLDRAGSRKDADLLLIDDVARYPRATWFLNRLACSSKRGLCSPDADARMTEAAGSSAPAERAARMAEAEAELTAANVFIPFGAPIRWSLVRGTVGGFAANSWGWHPLMPLARRPK